MPSQGWQHTDQRACQPQSPAIVCLSPDSQGPYELEVGDRVLLPGECAHAPAPDVRGRARVALRASGEVQARPRVHVRPGVQTEITIEGEPGQVETIAVDLRPCDGRVPER